MCAKDVSSFMHLNFTRTHHTYSAIEEPQTNSSSLIFHCQTPCTLYTASEAGRGPFDIMGVTSSFLIRLCQKSATTLIMIGLDGLDFESINCYFANTNKDSYYVVVRVHTYFESLTQKYSHFSSTQYIL